MNKYHKTVAGWAFAVLVLLFFCMVPLGLSQEDARVFGVILFTVVLWIFEPVPAYVSTLLLIPLLFLIGVPPAEALTGFSDPTWIFVVSVGFEVGTSLERRDFRGDKEVATPLDPRRVAHRRYRPFSYSVLEHVEPDGCFGGRFDCHPRDWDLERQRPQEVGLADNRVDGGHSDHRESDESLLHCRLVGLLFHSDPQAF